MSVPLRLGRVANAYSNYLEIVARDARRRRGGLAVEIGGCGVCDVFRVGADSLVTVEHYGDDWDDEIERDFLRTIVEQPTAPAPRRVGVVELKSGVIALLPALEARDGAAASGAALAALTAAGGAAQHGEGLLVALPRGRYEIWVDQLDVEGEWGSIVSRCRVVPAGTKVLAGRAMASYRAPRAATPVARVEPGERRLLSIPRWDALASVDVSRDGRYVVAGEKGGARVCCWRADGELLWEHELAPRATSSRYSQQVRVGLDPDGRHALALVGYGDALFRIGSADGELQRHAAPRPAPRAVRVSPDGASAVLRAGTGAWLLEYPSLRVIGALEGYCNRDHIAQTPDGELVATCGVKVDVFRRAGREHLGCIAPAGGGPLAIEFSADGRELALACRDAVARFFDARSLAPLREVELAPERSRKPAITSLSFSSDGRWLAATGDDGAVRLLDARSLLPLTVYAKHNTAIPDTGARRLAQAVFSASSRWLLVSASPKGRPSGVSAYAVG